MDPTSTARFADACGATGPLDLVVEREDGVVVAQGTLAQPFAVLGRDAVCDVALAGAEVSPRHAVLQVVGGHVFVADLGSKTGIEWPDGRRPYGWLVPEEPVRVGRYRIFLARPASTHPILYGPTFHPLAAGPDVPTTLPPVEIEFRNGRSVRSFWNVNRVMTIIGRAKDCKIHLGGDDVSLFHCYLILTEDGLWVTDLFGRGGVRVNGTPVRCRRLNHNDEIKVGRFVLGCIYPSAPGDTGLISFDMPRAARPKIPAPSSDRTDQSGELAAAPAAVSTMAPPGHGPLATARSTMTAVAPPADAERTEAEPGRLPHLDADLTDFAAITPPPDAAPPPPDVHFPTPVPKPPSPFLVALVPELIPAGQPVPPGMEVVVPMLRQMGEMQGQMFSQFQQSLIMMMQMFGQMHREQMDSVQQELGRMADLNRELQNLQLEIRATNAPTEPPPPAHENHLPDPDALPPATAETADAHNAVWERMSKIHAERQTVWQKLFGLMTPPK